MKLFDNYLDSISGILNKSQIRGFSANVENSRLPTYYEKSLINESLSSVRDNQDNKILIQFDKSQLTTLFGQNPASFSTTSIGSHPDFAGLKYHEYEKHFCVSMFMDIKGSTRLNEKYTLPEIRKIKDTILTLAIYVAAHFGGHVHRLQGDGIFLQFVRKGQKEQDAVINALNTASVLSHFITSDLAAIFNQNGVTPLRVRIGIDLGYADNVIWSHYGIPGCSELTTTSLHTDLAAKLQAKAKSNGVLVGGNIKDILDIKDEFCKPCYDDNGAIDYYIYQGAAKNYRKYDFNWQSYLKSFDFVKGALNSLEIEIPEIRLVCKIKKQGSDSPEIYNQNSCAIPKDSEISYTIFQNGYAYHRKDFETIEWKIVNSGKEANAAGHLILDLKDDFKNKTSCNVTASYLGHHYIECVIKRPHSDNIKLRFPIFVK